MQNLKCKDLWGPRHLRVQRDAIEQAQLRDGSETPHRQEIEREEGKLCIANVLEEGRLQWTI